MYFIAGILSIIIVVLAIFQTKKIENIEEKEDEKINFESPESIELYNTQNDQIENVNLNYYLLCVVASEIPFKYEYEAIKAQVVVARTYLFNKIVNNLEEKGDVCDDYRHCQAYTPLEKLNEIWKNKGFTDKEIEEGKEKIQKAILDTKNQVIIYNGKIIDALFHASSPQRTEDAKAIWSCEDIPYLKSVENVEDETYENRNSQTILPYSVFKNTLIEKGYVENLTDEEMLNTKISEYTDSGRVKTIQVGNYKIKAEDLRTLFGIKSTNFTLSVDSENIVFNVIGYGHGVGLSQVGANTYAKLGKTYDEIIHHYYTGVDIVDGYEYTKEK